MKIKDSRQCSIFGCSRDGPRSADKRPFCGAHYTRWQRGDRAERLRRPFKAYGFWSDEDEAVLKSRYPELGAEGLQDEFPNKSLAAIQRKANYLGLNRYEPEEASKSPTVQDIQWAAGFLEGEGTFRASSTNSESVVASQVQKEPLERMQRWFGGSLHQYDRADYENKYGLNAQPIWVWGIHGERARGLMQTVFSLMSPKRKSEIEDALS